MDGVLLSDISDIGQNTDKTNADELEEDFDASNSMVTSNTNCTLENERRRFRKEDEYFWELYSNIASQIQSAVELGSEERYLETINTLATENLEIQRSS